MITFRHRGKFTKTERFFERIKQGVGLGILDKYGAEGVKVLSEATPVDSGKTATSWYYEIENRDGNFILHWNNSNVNDGVNIAVIIQYGHGTSSGYYVEGIDYINPSIRPLMKKIASDAWKELIAK